ncbi:calcium-activated chloride channel regulator 1-like isoform X1 [Dermacentor albipictus]|uniref:calcium-activated chloride channel regulator 1-like isoform X1 n=1 Tax=Dermacentor albipictus TaxID=60249 RepID=UPI0038FD0C72
MEFPNTWPHRITARSEPKYLFSKSDVRVEALKSGHKGGSFSTKLRRRCGQRGDFIRVSPDVLAELNTTKEALNDATYAFVNEWAHYRYGVFYEYGRLGHNKYPLSYCPCCNEDAIRWNSCSDRIHHVILNPDICEYHDGCYATEDCEVSITQPEQDPVESSIMFLPRLHNVKHFCNSKQRSHRHNNLAPNMQNEICNGESTWDVIRRNKDFMRIPPPNMSKPILVEFDEIQQKPGRSLRAVLVIDVSRSMKAHKRLETVKEALDGLLLRLPEDLVQLAIVTYSTTANVQHPMRTVNHRTVKGFRDALKMMSPDGDTCIGCGLQRALEALNTPSESPDGAIIVLLTDGVENQKPHIDDVWPQLLAGKVQVVTMAMGDKAEEKLEKLAAETKGQSYFFPDRLQNLSRTYIEANSSAPELTYHGLGLIPYTQTSKRNATEPLIHDEGTTEPNHHELKPQIAKLQADAEISLRTAKNELTTLAESAELVTFQSTDGECFPSDGYNPNVDISLAFKDPFNLNKKYSHEPLHIMHKTKRFTGTVQETFIVDEGLGNNTIATITPLSTGRDSLTGWLVDPTGKRCQSCLETENDEDKLLTIPSPAMPGTWTLHVECSSQGPVVVSMVVTSQIRDVNNEPIVALCEASEDEVEQPEDAIIFVDLSKGSHVVLDANVTVVVRNTQRLSCPARLRDDGKGPDIMADDGTYSGFFTQFTGEGRYAIWAYIYGDNKTSHAYRRPGFPPDAKIWDGEGPLPPSVPVVLAPDNYTFKDTLLGEREPTAPFQRVAYGSYFKVTRDLWQTDVPPGQIRDLKAVDGYVEIDRTAVLRLTWTWPGARMTHGLAAGVEIRGDTSRDNLERDFDSQELLSNVVKGNLDPLPPGSKHDVSIALPRDWETTTPDDSAFKLTAYVAARVINADGLKGKPSRSLPIEYEFSNISAKSLTTRASISTRAVSHRKPGAATTTTPEKPYMLTGSATTSTGPTKTDPAREPAAATTADAENATKNDDQPVILWILLALVAAIVIMFIAIRLLLRAESTSIAENQGSATNTLATTTM